MKKEIPAVSAYKLLNHGPVVLLTSIDKKGNPNIMSLAWITVVNSEPPLVSVAVGDQAYSQKSISDTGEFVINIPSVNNLKNIIYCGTHSFRGADKFNHAGWSKIKSRKIAVPKIKECCANIECRVVKKIRFSDVVLFVAEMLYAEVEKDLWGKCFDANKAGTLHHLGDGFFFKSGKKFKA